MKIVFHAPRFHTNQFESVRALQECGHQVEYHVSSFGETEDYSLLKPKLYEPIKASFILERYFSKSSDKRFLFPSPLQYFQNLKQSAADIIVIRNPQRVFSLIAAVCARLLGVKVIFYTQTALHKKYTLSRRFLTATLLKVFNAAWMTPLSGCVSEYPDHPRDMFYVPFSVPRWSATPPKNNMPIKILSIGKMVPRKNHVLLLRALSRLVNDYDFKLTIIGECVTPAQEEHYNRLLVLSSLLGLNKKVEIITNVAFEKVKDFYRSHDVFILAASGEPASISVLEACANGLPSVCSTTCGTRFYIKDGYNGYVFKSGSEEDLSKKVENLLCLGGRLEEMKQNAMKDGEETMSKEAYIFYFSKMLGLKWGIKLI